jgi:hypothetical protein
VRALYAATLGLSAFLLFVVQPLLGAALLPLLGGAPAVWTTTLLFFQAALLAGYGWAHVASTRIPWHTAVPVHLLLLCLGLLHLPFGTAGAAPPTSGEGLGPALWLGGWLVVAVGLPVVALSASAPLLQGWIARAGDRDPYPLYAASNVGSFVALLGYPLVVERTLGVAAQARAWAVGYGLLLASVLACAAVAWRRGQAAVVTAAQPPPAEPPPALRRRLRWLLLSAVPVCLLLGVTTHLTAEVSAAPLLWVLPLAAYLLTFIVAFGRGTIAESDGAGRDGDGAAASRALGVLAAPLVLALAVEATPPLGLALLLDLALLTAVGLVCHGALARDRPAPEHLSAFYLVLAAGGVVGGLLCALVAPALFSSVLELPLAIVAACALRPAAPEEDPRPSDASPPRAPAWARPLATDLGWAGLVLAVALGLERLLQAVAADLRPDLRLLFAFAPAVVLAHAAKARPARHALALAALFGAGLLADGSYGEVLHRERSFFGVVRVAQDATHRYLLHGQTIHGVQALDPAKAREPLAYYHRRAPGADVVRAWRAGPTPRRVAAVGLGAGALAAHSLPDEAWVFYEIDPAVVRVAQDPRSFTYLRDAPGKVSIELGDARRRIAEAPEGSYGLLLLDAFSGDAVPAHLLTTEGLSLQLRAVAPDGLLGMHISNRTLDLLPVVARTARALGLVGRAWYDLPAPNEERPARIGSLWVTLARSEAPLARLGPQWQPLPVDDGPPWTDDHHDVLGALRLLATGKDQ